MSSGRVAGGATLGRRSQPIEPLAVALARLYDLDLADDPGDVDLYLALAARAGDPIVELAAGTGRVAVPLAAAGHRVRGVDIDEAMLARARQRAEAAELSAPGTAGRLEWRIADLRLERPSADRPQEARLAILALNSLFVFAERSEQAAVIARLAGLVAPGGVVVVDTWQPQAVDLVRMDGRVSLEWLREDPETGRPVTKAAAAWFDPSTRIATVTTIFEEGGQGEPSVRWTRADRLRLTTADELVDWSEQAGLEVERVAGDYDLSPFGPASERAILVAHAPG